MAGTSTQGDTLGKPYFEPGASISPSQALASKRVASDRFKQRGDDMASQFPNRRKAPIALIVEDDPDVRELAAALLEETDLRVLECENAEQAIAILAREGEDVALVFSDIRLPGLDGVDLARQIKAVWPHVSIVVTSGYSERRPDTLPENVVYMPKPWLALDVLMQADRASAWMRRAQPIAS
jgi:CheY-like chemotaxis protein